MLISTISLLSSLLFLRDSFKNIISRHKPCRTILELFPRNKYWPPIGKIAAHSVYEMFSWYKYLIVSLVFSLLGFWSGSLFLIAHFPDLCLLVLFFNVFQYSALKGVVSLYLTRPFICQLHHVAFDGLKSHSPFPSPTA